MDISGIKVDSIIKVEELNPTLKFGGDNNSKNVAIHGNLVVNQIYMGTVSANNPDLIAQKAEALTGGSGVNVIDMTKNNNVHVVVSPFMGIMKSPDLSGTGIHLEFAVTNESDMPKIINGAYVRLNDGRVHFKRFFKINSDSSRVPDFTTRFPIIINAKGAANFAIEFENVEQALIAKGEVKGQLLLITGDETVAGKEFILDVNDAMVNTLNKLQETANENKAPVIFDAMLKS